jgi:type IV pilus assembly protein PilW
MGTTTPLQGDKEEGNMKAKENSDLGARATAGFTLIELLVAMALGLVIMGGLFRTFKVQHDSYVVQDQVAAMQQNLRAAMYMITRDLQMAGYYTNFDRNSITMDWNADGSNETGRPLLFARNDITAPGNDIREGTDEIVIVKASLEEGRPLAGNESASGTSIRLNDWNLEKDDPDSTPDLNPTSKKYGVLVKNDLSRAELFQLGSSGSLDRALRESYSANAHSESLSDRIHRVDMIIYRVEKRPAGPCLVRRNLGNDSDDFQVVAENIENLQVRYLVRDTSNPTGFRHITTPGANQSYVRAVEVFLIGRTAFPQRGYRDTATYTFGEGATAYNYTPTGDDGKYRRKVLTTLVKTRNIGL